MSRTRSRYWRQEGAYKVLVGRPERKRPLERHGCRWEDSIKMDQDVGRARDWIDLARNREKWRALVNAAIILQVP
jgi:hypothetical protein